jgi:hypothetical protein
LDSGQGSQSGTAAVFAIHASDSDDTGWLPRWKGATSPWVEQIQALDISPGS